MKKTIFSLFSTFILSMMPWLTHAAWYEVTGMATVVASEDAARLHALEDAIYKAVNFSGADIGSISNLRPLLEDGRKEYQFTNHEVRYVLVEEQKIYKDVMFVKARIDIYPSATGCHVDQYKKTFLVSNIDLASPQQAV
ncbi:MAG TPA: flagellar basal-body protein, partial [Vibrio sp.]|nr:flagellar basal-body protein [Vibrio sp.]